MVYQPQPLDTTNIQLPDDLSELVTRLAENIHENWAKKRMSEGWQYGPQRDDANKKHPDLVPYSSLPASEQEYDRITVIESLKSVIALGFKIIKA